MNIKKKQSDTEINNRVSSKGSELRSNDHQKDIYRKVEGGDRTDQPTLQRSTSNKSNDVNREIKRVSSGSSFQQAYDSQTQLKDRMVRESDLSRDKIFSAREPELRNNQ